MRSKRQIEAEQAKQFLLLMQAYGMNRHAAKLSPPAADRETPPGHW